jgi:hypothetical protein
VAVLNVIEQAGNMHVRDFSNCGVPCFNLGTDDGRFLTSVMERATAAGTLADLRIAIGLDTEMINGLKGQNTVGGVAGRRQDEVVIVNAHADGWFDAAGDNGDGLAVLVALARHFAKPEHRPERTLLFVASGGHHGGGLNGPGNLVRMHPELKDTVVLVLNLEHIAQLRFSNDPFKVEGVEQPMGFGISNEAPRDRRHCAAGHGALRLRPAASLLRLDRRRSRRLRAARRPARAGDSLGADVSHERRHARHDLDAGTRTRRPVLCILHQRGRQGAKGRPQRSGQMTLVTNTKDTKDTKPSKL